jgi:hypothetical protein
MSPLKFELWCGVSQSVTFTTLTVNPFGLPTNYTPESRAGLQIVCSRIRALAYH